MGAAYIILGKSIAPQYLALGTVGAVLALVVPKPWNSTPKKEATIAAGSSEEEKFIKEYLEKNAA